MLGKTHQLVANLSLACLSQKERHIMYPRWGGIESGATLSDEFRIMWEIEEVGSDKKQLRLKECKKVPARIFNPCGMLAHMFLKFHDQTYLFPVSLDQSFK